MFAMYVSSKNNLSFYFYSYYMKFIHIDNSKSDIEVFNKYVAEGKHVFVLIFMVGCGPCMQTIPKWKQLENDLKKKYAHDDNVVIADINKEMSSFIKHIGAIEGYPTMKYIGNKGNKVETYEESVIPIKDRSTESFIKWVETKISKIVGKTQGQQHKKTIKSHTGGARIRRNSRGHHRTRSRSSIRHRRIRSRSRRYRV